VQGASTTYDYDYDLAGRLIEVSTNGSVTATYGYDSNSNRTHENGLSVASYDAQDRLILHGDHVYTYTDNGELLTKTNTTTAEVTQYDYDVLGNLISVTVSDTTSIEYVLDGQNRRVGKKVNGTLTQGFLYKDRLNPVAELDENGDIVSRFIYGSKVNVPDYMVKDGITYRIISNHLGSPRLVVNASDGSVAQQIDYDEWGDITNDTNPGFQPFGFAGGVFDQDAKLTRFGARDYDTVVGRWVSKDPLGFAGEDSNLFGYVENDPVNWIDPQGLAKSKTPDGYGTSGGTPHKSGARNSTTGKHQDGQANNKKSRGREKGDNARKAPRKRPSDWRGKWPPPSRIIPLVLPLPPAVLEGFLPPLPYPPDVPLEC
jgi:RHS repeat-associated protein